MIGRKNRILFFAPTDQYVEATIIRLTRARIQKGIHQKWWADSDLLDRFVSPPIDRHWDWNEIGIEYEGRVLRSERIAIMTGDNAIQGAMLISAQPIPSRFDARAGALFIELLFTAPWNRPNLRRDGRPLFLGVGTELLTWGAWLSKEMGYHGRLLLDASPDYVDWYRKRGLQIASVNPILFEGTRYTPMELPPEAAVRLIEQWE